MIKEDSQNELSINEIRTTLKQGREIELEAEEVKREEHHSNGGGYASQG